MHIREIMCAFRLKSNGQTLRGVKLLCVKYFSLTMVLAACALSWPVSAAGVRADADFFPIGVWLQSPGNAAKYKAAEINLYVGLWRGPTEAQLTTLREANMPVICAQNSFGLSNKANPIIVGWMHSDEPDNAQSRRDAKGYGPPILPERIVENYQKIRAADPSRPVLLNLGQGVAWDNYIGRSVRRNHPEDYPEYVKGCDIASFDIYPAVHDNPAIAGKLEFVGKGVERLIQWAGPERTVWNCIECIRISNEKTKPMSEQVRAEVWMSIIQGSRGLIYFVHQFKPTSKEAALLDDPEMLVAITAINRQVQELAPVINSRETNPAVQIQSAADSIWFLAKRHKGATWLFVANHHNQAARANFLLRELGQTKAEVLGESRSVSTEQGQFADNFAPYAVHLYRLGDANHIDTQK